MGCGVLIPQFLIFLTGPLQPVIQYVYFFFALKETSTCSVSISEQPLLVSGHRNVLSLAQAKTGLVRGF